MRSMDASSLRQKLQAVGQSNVLRFWDKLPAAEQQTLSKQIESLDLEHIRDLAETQVRTKAAISPPKKIDPVQPCPPVPDAKNKQLYADAQTRGHDLLKQGK